MEDGCGARQAERHAHIAVRWTVTLTSTRRAEALLRRGPVEPWDVDADAQLTILARVGSYTRWAVVAAHCHCFLKLLSGLDDELLSARRSSPGALLRETCREARLHVVPERLPRDLSQV